MSKKLKLWFWLILHYLILVSGIIIFYHLTREVLEAETLNLDLAVNSWITNFRNPALTQIMIQISLVGQTGGVILVSLLGLYLIVKKQFLEFFRF